MPQQTNRVRVIVEEKQIDNGTVLRTDRPLSREMCDICGFNVCERNNVPPYEVLPEELKKKVRDALREHKRLAHPGESSRAREAPAVGSWTPGQAEDKDSRLKPREFVSVPVVRGDYNDYEWSVE